LPASVEHLAGGPLPSAEADVVAAAAQDFAAGRGSEDEFVATQLLPQLGPDEEIDWVIDDGSAAETEQQADLTLRDIYARETDSHVAVVRDYLLRASSVSAPHVLPETVYRACHTLLGSSRMAEARHGMRLSQPLDSWLRKAYEAGVGLSDQDLQLLAECMAAMERISRHLDEGTQFFDSHESLCRRIEATALAIDQRSSAPLVQYDREIAAVFSDEASELLEAAQAAMAQLPPSHSGAVPDLSPLKRPLHTLKGGARMAGVIAMGDLAHEMETLVTQVEQGLVPWNDAAHGVMQAAIDELSRMRDLLSAGQPVAGSALPTRGPAPVPVLGPEPIPEPEPLPVLEPPVFEPVVPAPQVPGPPAPAPGALLPPGRDAVGVADRPELARVDADLLDQLLNNVGEVSIARSRVEQQFELVGNNLGELARTVTRLKQQLRSLELETEAQILHRHQTESADQSGFDPLELDRYSAIQQFSRALAETASDVASIQQLLETQSTDAQDLLQQQGRVVSELQNGLLRTRMVSFQRHVQRLTRIVRQTSADTGKHTEFVVEGASAELDRQLLERMLPPLEHLLRNAVVHGIESPAMRRALAKPEAGRISLSLQREGAEVVLTVADDGAGLDLPAIRTRAVAAGLLAPDRMLPDDDLMQLVLEPGFSTAASVTPWAGRGVGLDVVATEVRKLGGVLQMHTRAGAGSRFAVRLPFTMAVAQALLVRIGDENYALPLPMVDSVVRLPAAEVAHHMGESAPAYVHGGQRYRLQHLGVFVGLEPAPLPAPEVTVPVALVRAGEHSTGLIIDELLGSREIVLKNVGPQIAAIRGLSGATILADGRVAIILDIGTLLRTEGRQRSGYVVHRPQADHRPVVLVVDDSITVRRVTQRLLERNGMQVLTARDGEDALSLLAEVLPDIVLLDVEMPRMDGYELAQRLRAQPRTEAVPIIMITSRVGAKHRARALELGVNDYLGKPYQEAELLAAIAPLVAAKGSP
jgi:chemosensory pili system protein ChpA (sensor histidine kinase/response regulator)